jgi:hypothetical protein
MITRAQAEALLTLAESLEACERLDMHLATDQYAQIWTRLKEPSNDFQLMALDSMSVRLAVNDLVPKHTGS